MTDAPNETQTQYRLIGPSDSGEVNDLLTDLSVKDAKHRLQALIAEWLRMENLVVLTESGTSVSGGGKVMAIATSRRAFPVPAAIFGRAA